MKTVFTMLTLFNILNYMRLILTKRILPAAVNQNCPALKAGQEYYLTDGSNYSQKGTCTPGLHLPALKSLPQHPDQIYLFATCLLPTL